MALYSKFSDVGYQSIGLGGVTELDFDIGGLNLRQYFLSPGASQRPLGFAGCPMLAGFVAGDHLAAPGDFLDALRH